jgi:tryptophan halogenase
MYKICIVGGGTAGAIVASIISSYFNRKDVEIITICSKDIKKIGVGESTTPAFLQYLNNIGIPPSKMITECNATIKNGIRFENWQGNGDCYWNNFNSGGVVDNKFSNVSVANSIYKIFNIMELHEFVNGNWSGGLNHSFELDKSNKIPFIKNDIGAIVPVSSFAFHIDAQLFSEYIFDSIKDQITFIDSKITEVKTNDTGISKIVLEDGTSIVADFWIDCSGLTRLLINNLDPEWESFSEDLMINSALVGNIVNNSLDKSPVTIATAMKNGWSWQIPLQSRYGIGYVFNDQLSKDKDVESEFRDFVKIKYNSLIENIRKINFTSGCLKNNWIKNCVAIGLSSGFIEPLESTNIHTICLQATHLLFHLPFDNKTNPARKKYNKKIYDLQKQIKTVIKLHYLGRRSDTEFWKKMQICSNELADDIDMLKNCWLTEWNDGYDRNQNTGSKMFGIQNIQPIVLGLNLLDKEISKNFYDLHIKRLNIDSNTISKIIKGKSDLESKYITQENFLNSFLFK